MLKKILLGVIVVIAGFLVYVAVQPADYLIAREVVINAKPESIFSHLNNSKKLNAWMPWADSDPNVKMNYSGPTDGIGATTSWESTGSMGVGRAVIIQSIANQNVKTQITYEKPMVMEQVSDMTLTAKNGGTAVKWSVVGKNSFMGRLFCTFMNMDKMVGGEFEKGLNKLKNIVERG